MHRYSMTGAVACEGPESGAGVPRAVEVMTAIMMEGTLSRHGRSAKITQDRAGTTRSSLALDRRVKLSVLRLIYPRWRKG